MSSNPNHTHSDLVCHTFVPMVCFCNYTVKQPIKYHRSHLSATNDDAVVGGCYVSSRQSFTHISHNYETLALITAKPMWLPNKILVLVLFIKKKVHTIAIIVQRRSCVITI